MAKTARKTVGFSIDDETLATLDRHVEQTPRLENRSAALRDIVRDFAMYMGKKDKKEAAK